MWFKATDVYEKRKTGRERLMNNELKVKNRVRETSKKDWSCCLRRVSSRPVEELVPEWRRGGVWVETREVPMPRKAPGE